MQKHYIPTLLAAVVVALLGFTSCNNDDDNTPSAMALVDFMTFESQSTSSMQFTYQRGANSPQVTLSCAQTFNTEVEPGTRMVVMFYAPGDTLPATNTTIQLVQAQRALTAPARVVNIADSVQWNQNSLYLTSISRTGRYLNVVAGVNTDISKQQFGFWADEATLSTDTPVVYLVNLTEGLWSYTLTPVYASFDLKPILERATSADQVEIRVNNSNNTELKSFKFPL